MTDISAVPDNVLIINLAGASRLGTSQLISVITVLSAAVQ